MLSMKHLFWLLITLLAMGFISACVPHRPSMHHPHHLQNSVFEQSVFTV